MRDKYRTVLYINLSDRKAEFKTHADLVKYIGGVGIAYKLLLDNLSKTKFIVATGPMSGLFPFVSKAVLVYRRQDTGKTNEMVGGGSIGAMMNLAGIDAIVVSGETHEPLEVNISNGEVVFSPIQETVDSGYIPPHLSVNSTKVISDGFFSFGEPVSEIPLLFRLDINIKATEEYDIYDYYGYKKIYNDILEMYKELEVEPRNNPSCFGCPIGCDLSGEGEDKLRPSVLSRCLVGCGYANQIYKEIPLVYSCLSSIGYTYYHSDLANISDLVGELKSLINK